MCRPASFVITNKNKNAHWSKTTNSHTAIRKEHGLPENKPERIYSVAVEVVPPGGDLNRPIESWLFIVDQDMLPDWWDAEHAEKTARRELKEWDKSWLVRGVMPELHHGQHPVKLFKEKNRSNLDRPADDDRPSRRQQAITTAQKLLQLIIGQMLDCLKQRDRKNGP